MDPAPTPPEDDAPDAPPAPAAPSRVAALRGRAEGLTDQGKKLVDETRSTVPPVDIGFSAFERDNHIGGFLMAGAIAFRMFVYVLPLYLLALVVAGAVFTLDPKQMETATNGAGMSGYLAKSITDAGGTSSKSLWLLIPVTLYALISAGRSMHKAIAAAHTRAWGITSPKSKAYLVAPAVLGFSFVVLGIARFLSVIRHGALVPVAMGLGAGLYIAFWLAVSWFLPRPKETGWWALVPGAVLFGAGTQGLYLFNVLYLNRKITEASQAYGMLGVAASALLWLYLLGRLIVAAPVLNATLWSRRHESASALGTAPDDVLINEGS